MRTRLLIASPCIAGFVVNVVLLPIAVAISADVSVGVSDALQLVIRWGPTALLTALMALPPYIIVSAAVYLMRRWTFARRVCLAGGGTIVLLALHGWMQVAVWQSSSSTAVLALLFMPIYGAVAVWPGLLIGWLVSLLPILPEDSRPTSCPQCGYELHGRYEAGCPECGYRRSG